jgi:hypothetical protein
MSDIRKHFPPISLSAFFEIRLLAYTILSILSNSAHAGGAHPEYFSQMPGAKSK